MFSGAIATPLLGRLGAAGLLTEIGGVRAAYGLGLLMTVIAFGAAWRAIPTPPEGRSARLDIPGAILLTGGLFLALYLASEMSLWSRRLDLAIILALGAVLLFGVWTAYEHRADAPLVDIRSVRHPAVSGANLAMLVGGIGMYLLLTLITRYAQTPHSTGYGFRLSTFVASLVLVPFSALGFVAGRLTPQVRQRIGAPFLLAGSAVVVLLGFVLFATVAAGTNTDSVFPTDGAYTTAAVVGITAMAVIAVTSIFLGRSSSDSL